MKKSIFALVLGAFSMAVPAFAQVETLPPAPTNSSSLATGGPLLDGQTWLWRVQPEVGARYEMRLFSRSETNLPNTEAVLVTVLKTNFDYHVLSRDRFGATTVRLTYRDFQNESAFRGGTAEMSRSLETAGAVNQRLRAALVGQSFEIKMAPNGKIWNIVGYDTILKRIAGTSNDPAVQAALGAFDENSLKSTLGEFSGAVPSQPVRVSESWTYTVPSVSIAGTTTSVSGQRTLKSLENGVALVGENAQMLINVDSPSGATLDDFSGTINGSSRVDVQSGLVLESDLTMQLRGAVVTTQNGQTQRFPLSSRSQTRIVMEPRS